MHQDVTFGGLQAKWLEIARPLLLQCYPALVATDILYGIKFEGGFSWVETTKLRSMNSCTPREYVQPFQKVILFMVAEDINGC